MDDDEIYLFDLCGYIVVKNVLTAKEVAAAHAAVERNLEKAVISKHRKGIQRVPDGTVLGDTSRWDLRGMLGWEAEDRRPFVKMLAHPKLTRYVNTICGKGFRMDHAPTLITQTKGSPAGGLHGSSGPGFDPASYYVWQNGSMHNGLVVVSFQLVDCPEGAGGLAVVPGSHKGNVRMPAGMRSYEKHSEFIRQATCNAGDVVIFTEATTQQAAANHSGTLPWTASYQRRSVLFRYAPANVDFAGGRHAFDSEHRRGKAWPENWYDSLTDAQRAVLEPPYVPGLERPVLGDDGELTPASMALIEEHGWDGIGRNPYISSKL